MRKHQQFVNVVGILSTVSMGWLTGTARADEPLYREIFPLTSGSQAISGAADTGWRWYVTNLGLQADAFNGSAHTSDPGAGTHPDLGGAGLLPPVNSNPQDTAIAEGYVRNTFGGSFWQSESFFLTEEYTIDRSAFEVTRFTWAQASNSDPADTTRVAARVGGIWYVTEQTQSAIREPFAMQFWAPDSQSIDFSSATWRPLNFELGTVMSINTSSAPAALPAGDITGVGLWWDKMSTRGAFDAFTVWGQPATVNAVWGVNDNGDWGTSGSWTGGVVPNAATASATFGSTISAPVTVSVVDPVTVNKVVFNNANRYTISGAPITLGGVSPEIRVEAGSHTFDTGVILSSATLIDVAPAQQLNVKWIRGASVNVSGRVQINSGSDSTSQVAGLSVATGVLDLNGSSMIVNYDPADPSPITSIQSLISSGRLIDSTPDARLTIGYGEKTVLNVSSWGGLTVDDSSVLIRVALAGDFDLDNTVGFSDLVTLARNYNNGSRLWTDGDANHDGMVDFSDLVSLARNYNVTLTGSIESDWALALSIVPEPSSLAVVGAVSLLGLRRRRRD